MENRVENIVRTLLQAISPFLTMFSTAIYLYCVQMRYCVVMGKLLFEQVLCESMWIKIG